MFKHNLYLYLGSFIGGVATRSFFNFGFSFIILFFLLFSFFLLDYFLRRHRVFLFLSLIFIFFGLGLLRFDLSDSDFSSLSLSNLIEKEVQLKGVIVEEPRYGENSTTLIFKPGKEKILIITENFSPLIYGDIISVKGFLKRPENFVSDNNKEFDYVNYLAKDEIYYQMLFPKVTFLDKGGGNFIKSKLFSLKNILTGRIEKIIPSPEGEYLNGLLFGVKESLGKKLENQFRNTGLIHVVVLSGYNVSLVAEAIMRSLSFLPIVLKTSFGSLGIIFFVIMTGAGATTVRAGIMALLVILARVTGRDYDVTRALFMAGGLMIIHNPKILVFDVSFQLSFMATLGLIYLSPKIIEYLKFLPSKFQIRELMAATIATQLFVLPILLFKIGNLSIISPIANLIVLPFIPLTMLFGFLTSLLGLISSFVSLPLATLSYFLLHYQITIVQLLSDLPFASISIETFPLWALFLVYLVYFFVMKNLTR